MKLLCKINSNPKLAKSNAKFSKYLVTGLHLAPGRNVCPYASKGCLNACLNRCGHGRYQRTQIARQKKTQFFLSSIIQFKTQLYKELYYFARKCAKLGKIPAVRLNLTSDIAWEQIMPDMFSAFPQIQFYDYTKNPNRCVASYKLPRNYKLVFSRSESNDKDVAYVLQSGKCGIVIVFRKIPKIYKGRKVVNGDNHDLRFLDGKGIIGVTAKGFRAKQDKTGFVV